MFRNGTRHTFVSAAVTTALATASALAYTGPVLASSSSGKAHSQAIIGTGADAIIGTGADAIIGTGADAIIGTGADAIIGTGADAIIGTGADAIIGTGADSFARRGKAAKGNAIIGTGADAIIGTGADAIIGTGADAIIGTGADAIIGTGADAIIGTGADAIIGTGADAIIGTGADAIIGTGADAIIGTGADSVAHRGKVSSASSKRYLIASGPAEVLDAARGVIRVMGRTVSAPIDSNLFATVANAAGSGSAATVTIYGQVDSRGALSNAIAQPGSATYVPGASAIVVTDIVRSIDARTGTVLIGNLKVDYTAMLAVSAVPLKAGKVATIVGTQPQAGQAIIAQRIIAR